MQIIRNPGFEFSSVQEKMLGNYSECDEQVIRSSAATYDASHKTSASSNARSLWPSLDQKTFG